jgi:hypothetical protein
MGEPNVEAAWRAEFKRVHATEAFRSATLRQNFVGRVMKLKLSGSKRSIPTTIFGGPS